jgi:hypothetical protein
LTNLPLHFTSLFSGNKRKKSSKHTGATYTCICIPGSYGGQNMESDFKNRDRKRKKKNQQKTKFCETEEESFSVYLVTYVVSI